MSKKISLSKWIQNEKEQTKLDYSCEEKSG